MVRTKPLLRGWSHVLGFATCAVLTTILAVTASGVSARVTAIIYAVGICSMLGVSALYHRGPWGERGRALFSRLDHSTIFVGIAATYTPVAALTLHGWQRIAVLATAWGGGLLGAALVWTPLQLHRAVFTAIYAVVGWSAVIAVPQLLHGLGGTGFSLILIGGLAYTVGAVVYGIKRPDPWPKVFGFHEVFHACTLVGVGTHLAAIGLVVLPRA
jgi:hemolysin III